MKQTISIVLATYNGELFLREQLDSIYNQSLLADEVLVVDDCSTDGTVAILEEYHNKYGLKYVINDHNLRVNKNFEKGILLATGDYISLCDQDDVWFREKNETLYNKLQEIESNYQGIPCVVSSRNTFVDENLNVHHNTELKYDTEDYRETIIHHLSQGSSMMFNRKCIEFILPLPEYEDDVCYDTHIGYILSMVGRKYDLHQSLMFYRVHGNNVTASISEPSKQHSAIRRFRSPSVVPDHMIRTFIHAKQFVEKNSNKEKLNYVERIISLSEDINLFKRIWILISTPKIPMSARLYSVKAHIANLIFAR